MKLSFPAHRWLLLFVLLLPIEVMARALPDFTGLVDSASPAVVNISANRKISAHSSTPFGGGSEQQIPDIFRHFFGDGVPRGPREGRSSGSGFIISNDGYVLTNNHVVSDADEILVTLNDRRELVAELVGTDKPSDLALLKITDDEPFPVVKIGDSEKLRVGEWVLAIGSPFGFDHSVTAGIVSAIGRSLPSENYVPFIQTDVAINPGNSGGPLFNLQGEVIGVNSQIYTRSGGFMGLSFAIPMSVAMEVVDQLKSDGKVTRGWLGVFIQEVNKDLADSFGLEKPSGALIVQVLDDSPAEKAGIKEGDIITRFNGKEISVSADLPHMVGRIKAGTKAKLEVVRQGKKKQLDVVIGELPDNDDSLGSARPQQDSQLGLQLEPLPDDLRDEWGIDQGVLVSSVVDGVAAEAGIRRGDVITTINGKTVRSPGDFSDTVADLEPGSVVPVRVVRRGQPLFIPIRVPE